MSGIDSSKAYKIYFTDKPTDTPLKACSLQVAQLNLAARNLKKDEKVSDFTTYYLHVVLFMAAASRQTHDTMCIMSIQTAMLWLLATLLYAH